MSINRKKIWSLSWPVIIANFTIPLVGLTDTVIMGHMPNSLYIASIAFGGIVFNFVYAGLNFLRMGTTGITAQKIGEKNHEEVFFSLIRPLLLAFFIGIFIYLLKNKIYNFSLYFLTPNKEVQDIFKEYLFIRLIGLPFGLINMVFLGWFFGMQKTKSVMLQLIIINFANIISSIYFSIILDLGIYGVAIGSVIAQFSGLLISILMFSNFYKNLNFQKFNIKKIINFQSFAPLFLISKNLFLRTIFLVFVQAYLIKKAGLIGINELATMEILLVIFSLSSYSLDAFAHSAETLVGNSIGSKNKNDLYKSIKSSTELAIIFALIIGCIFYFFGNYLIAIFTDIKILRMLTAEIWALVIITPFISTLAFQLDGIFIGATLAKEMRNSIMIACLIFYFTLEFVIDDSLNLKNLYSCFLLFLIIRGIVLTMYLKRVFTLTSNK